MTGMTFARSSICPVLAGTLALAVALGLVLALATSSGRGPRGRIAEARALLDRGRPDLASGVVSPIGEDGPGSGEAGVVEGMALVRLGKVDQARRALERALATRQGRPMAAKILAAIALSSGDAAGGLDYLEVAARSDPRDARPWLAIGKVRHDLGECARAIPALEEAMRLDPKGREGRLALVGEWLDVRRPEEATRRLVEALAEEPDAVEWLSLASVHARDLGQSAEAVAFADRALSRDPRDFESLRVRAWVASLSGRFGDARADLERALAIRPADLGALQALAQAESRLGQVDRAAATAARLASAREHASRIDSLAREVARAPRDASIHWRLGRAAAEAGQVSVARNCYRAALMVDRGFLPAARALATLPPDPPPAPGHPPR